MNKSNSNSLLSNIKVLFVEDEENAREELSRFLKRRVGKLYIGKNGMEGLNFIESHNPDMVVTDLKMPILDGLEMIKRARNMGYDGAIIVLSALSDSETILKAVDIGIVKYLVKPVDTDKLVDTMEQLASSILKKRLKKVVVRDSILLDKEKKQELEQKIKSEVAHFMKSYTGKGPKNVQVFIQGNNIDIKAESVLTLFENNLIINNRNHSLVDYNRRLFYMENKEILEGAIESVLNSKVELEKVEPDSFNNSDYLLFTFI
ncbi:putative C4-dicarboxylate response regulator dctR [Proteiniborus sp. DW1]|uniref:Na-translocating system protein MpsC family protein n=1 Tax=Proteiniborus sp. DW1 TaxID=1889883 RepID=UPI00092E03F5|nr:Na-translocating system protein MpsC family protein [Proteiniborus sp. DW1]SCG82818.1 putative C4-dicarboxylate response regulator dctR [Proteiniborus sp. DW1]